VGVLGGGMGSGLIEGALQTGAECSVEPGLYSGRPLPLFRQCVDG